MFQSILDYVKTVLLKNNCCKTLCLFLYVIQISRMKFYASINLYVKKLHFEICITHF